MGDFCCQGWGYVQATVLVPSVVSAVRLAPGLYLQPEVEVLGILTDGDFS